MKIELALGARFRRRTGLRLSQLARLHSPGLAGNERTSGLPPQGSPAGSVGRPTAFEFSVAAPAPAARPRTNHGAVDAAALLRRIGQISMSIASGQSVAVRGGSSGAWGRLLVRSGRRPRSLVGRGFRSRYFRSEDGHPSPSPDRKWINDGTERALMIGRTHQVLIRVPRAYTSVARTEESAHDAAWPGSAGGRPSVVFMIACVVDARGALVWTERCRLFATVLSLTPIARAIRRSLRPSSRRSRAFGAIARYTGDEPASMIDTRTGIAAAVRILCVRVHFNYHDTRDTVCRDA